VSEEELTKMAELTQGLSGAEIENIINLAALQTVRKAFAAKSKASSIQGSELIAFTTKYL
jgi:ATP-dependent Zn protease